MDRNKRILVYNKPETKIINIDYEGNFCASAGAFFQNNDVEPAFVDDWGIL